MYKFYLKQRRKPNMEEDLVFLLPVTDCPFSFRLNGFVIIAGNFNIFWVIHGECLR